MRLLRLIVAGLIGLAAMAAVALAAIVVFVTGLAALIAQALRGSPGPAPTSHRPPANRRADLRTDDAIEVVTTRVSDDQSGGPR